MIQPGGKVEDKIVKELLVIFPMLGRDYNAQAVIFSDGSKGFVGQDYGGGYYLLPKEEVIDMMEICKSVIILAEKSLKLITGVE